MLVRQLDNIRAVATTELANKRHCAVNALEESAWTHRSAYLETAEVVSDIKESPTKFDLRDIFADVGTIAFDLFSDTHVQTLPRSNTEQGKGAATSDKCKPVKRINFRFRQTTGSLRRADSVTLIDSITGALPPVCAPRPCSVPSWGRATPSPANDNPANDTWSPMEAA